ncbi:MAG: ion transporter [Spirochaetia bacterium]|jgi:voltage-gated potassium channel|nr:ion transporter [Spirochaetia bacterium]
MLTGIKMVRPDNRIRFAWEIFLLLTIIWTIINIPLSVIFFSRSAVHYANATEIILTAIFLTDIVIRFNTAVIKKRKLISSRREVLLIYLKGWFWLDFAAAIPFWFILGSSDFALPLQTLNFLRLARVLKLFRAVQTLRRARTSILFNPYIVRMILLVFWIFITAHLVACGWIFLEGDLADVGTGKQYLMAFYWTITTLTTIGYGDITPVETIQILYTICVQIIGAGLYGFIIGNIANLIANLDIARAQQREKIEKINTFMQYRNLPSDLQKKVNDYYNYIWETRRGYDESSVLHELPASLKTNISIFLNKEMIEKVPLFRGAGDALIRDIIMNLEPVVYTPDDYVVKKGEMGYDMYFISRGSVDVVSEDEKIVYATLSSGHFFGEIALLLSTPRTATIKTKEYCDLYRLNKDIFDRVLERYPVFAEKIKDMADKRNREIRSNK